MMVFQGSFRLEVLILTSKYFAYTSDITEDLLVGNDFKNIVNKTVPYVVPFNYYG